MMELSAQEVRQGVILFPPLIKYFVVGNALFFSEGIATNNPISFSPSCHAKFPKSYNYFLTPV